MNKKLFMYPVRFAAVLGAAAMITSCAKDKFTEASALELELKRLRVEDSIRVARERQQRVEQINLLRYQRALDSLDRINAGGRVFYSVAVVAAGNAAFGSGRSEEAEGVQGATVSISQYGNVQVIQTPASGIATAELRSGAATVVVSAPGHTTANYTVNLTPDGAGAGRPGNGSTVYVGNVLPLFPNTGAQTATVRGLALIETDLRNDTNAGVNGGNSNGAETVASIPAADRPTNLFTANVNINDVFRNRYLRNNYQASSNLGPLFGANGWEGDIQRIGYEGTAAQATFAADGSYSALVPAAAAGLPITLEYSSIGTNRTWWAGTFDGIAHNTVITRRFLYGPAAAATGAIQTGVIPGGINVSGAITVRDTEATGTVTVVNSGALQTETVGGVTYFVFNSTATGAARYIPTNAGAYLADVTRAALATTGQVVPPAVTFAAAPAGGTTATGVVELSDPAAGTNLRTVRGVRVTSAGAGYTGSVAATFTEGGNFTGVTGTGTLQAPTDQIGSIQVIDGGFGFRSTGGAPYGTAGQWTERAPAILFNGNQTLPAPKITPTVQFVRDGAIAGFVNGVSNVGTTLGTIQRIQVVTAGSGITPADISTITFDYGSGAVVPANDGAANGGDVLFTANASGGLEFNPLYGAGTTNSVLDLVASLPSAAGMSRGARPYVFVPSASLTGNTAGNGATFAVAVGGDGLISQVRIATPGSAYTAAGVNAANVVISTPSNSLSARGFLRGTGIDNYVFAAGTLGAAQVVTTFNTQTSTSLPPYTGTAASNNYIAVFDAPAAGGTQAEGVAVFDTQRRLIGLEITNPGVGYTGPVPFRIVAASAATAFRQAANASGSVGIVARGITIATTGGTGYALAPEVYFTGGGLTLAAQPAFAGTIDIDNSTGNLRGMTYTGAFTWDVNALAADPIRVVISSENHRININRAWNDLRPTRPTLAVGQFAWVPAANATGAITAINMRSIVAGPSFNADTTEWFNATGPNNYFNVTPFITAPRITLSGAGTGATAQFVLQGSGVGAPVSGAPTGGRVRALRITAGGAGYVTPATTTNSTTVPNAGRGFTVLNGAPANFEVVSGVTYVRDVHYGTGQYVDN